MPRLSVQQLFDERREKLQLTWVAGQKGASRELTHEALNRPGVGLVGHFNLVHPILMQALGSSDLDYLANQPVEAQRESLHALCDGETLCIFLCDGADAPEVQFRIGVRGANRASVERFTREIAPLVLNGPPSVTGFAGGRPKVEEVIAYWPALIDKRVVTTQVEVVS